MNLNEFPICLGKKEYFPFSIGKPGIEFDPIIEWPRISIVTPSFNQGKYIEETIRSVLLQNYPNLEYIIIDGGSTDETIAIIKKYEPWISYWVSEPDKGQSHAINKGISKCTGEIFNWLNSDDWYEPGCLHSVASAFMFHSSTYVVSGYENHIQVDGSVIFNTGSFITENLESTIEFCEIAQPSSFFKLSAIQNIGGVSEDLHYIMDGEMWLKLLLLYGQDGFSKIDKVLVNFRLHEASKTVCNSTVNNFLFERSSIIADLQRFIGVHPRIIQYYTEVIFKSPKTYQLNRNWILNPHVLTSRQLRLYFTRKFVMKQFRHNDRAAIWWGIKELIEEKALDGYLFKCLIKMIIST